MKNIFKTVAVAALVLATTLTAAAGESLKIGHVNTVILMQQLIVKDSVEFQLENLQREMQSDLQKKQAELNQSYQEYLVQKDSLSKIMVGMREESLRKQQQELEVLPAQYEQAFQATQAELMQPIRIKLEGAIKKLAAEGNYTYILDSASLLYAQGEDLTEKVRTKLGLPKPDPALLNKANSAVPGR